MLATRCACGFERLEDEEVTDHLLAVFEPDDATGSDGQVHEEVAGLSCSCSFRVASSEELEAHFIAVFTPVDLVGRDGDKHEPIA